VIWSFGKPESFCKQGWTEGSINSSSDLPVGLFASARSLVCAADRDAVEFDACSLPVLDCGGRFRRKAARRANPAFACPASFKKIYRFSADPNQLWNSSISDSYPPLARVVRDRRPKVGLMRNNALRPRIT
jgi:hypothetical protein